jgi:hypothetical protein
MGYLLKYQNPKDSYFNRYFLLKSRLGKEYGYSGYKIDKARACLLNSGFINENKGQLIITEEGKKYYNKKHQIDLMALPEKFTQIYEKKYSAIATILSAVVAVIACIIAYHK